MVCRLKYGEKETLANAPIEIMWVGILTSQVSVISLSFKTDNFNQINSALTEKYGAGISTKSIIQNRAGAAFDNEDITWTKGSNTMLLSQRRGKIDTAALIVTTARQPMIDEYKKRKLERIKENAKDL